MAGLLLALCAGVVNTASAFEALTEAQEWIYDTNHLANTEAGQTLEYAFISSNDISSDLQDQATLSITAALDKERRDVSLNFLTDERHISLPDFKGYRGNPILIAMLERVAQDMGEETGGGVLYFRNRIRDSLASDSVELSTSTASFNEKSITSTTLTFLPFLNDSYLGSAPLLRETVFTIQLSSDVPAGVVDVHVLAQSDQERFLRHLELK